MIKKIEYTKEQLKVSGEETNWISFSQIEEFAKCYSYKVLYKDNDKIILAGENVVFIYTDIDNKEDKIIEEILAKEKEKSEIPIDKVRDYLRTAIRYNPQQDNSP
jgi:hypothetical protein